MTDGSTDPRRAEAWLVRHGETEWSRDGRHTGRTDIPLTAAGEGVARHLHTRLVGERFGVVLTSPRERALRTCQLAGFGDMAAVDDDLVEWDYGVYEGRRTLDIRAEEPGWSIWTTAVADGESLAEVSTRADAVIARIRDQGERTLLFSHGHFSRILAARWTGQHAGLGAHLVLGTATVSVLGWERDRPAIVRWNA